MPKFTGTLNSNEIFSAIYNMIISQQVFSDNIKGTASSLVDRARVDGTLMVTPNSTTQPTCLNRHLGAKTLKQQTS